MPQNLRNERAKRADYHIDDATYERLSSQIQDSYLKLDATCCHVLRMGADFIETAEAIRMRPELTQKLIGKSVKMLESIKESRADLVSYHLTATTLRMQTNQAVRGTGTFERPRGEHDAPELRSVA